MKKDNSVNLSKFYNLLKISQFSEDSSPLITPFTIDSYTNLSPTELPLL